MEGLRRAWFPTAHKKPQGTGILLHAETDLPAPDPGLIVRIIKEEG
jgi:hypothetical protein